MSSSRVVIIGGGHNGLVAALHLAKAGFSPLVLERREVVGGVAAVEEIHPGFRCPAVMHVTAPLMPALTRPFGAPSPGGRGILALHSDQTPIRIYEDAQRTAAGLKAASDHDSRAYLEFHKCFKRFGEVLAPLLSMLPPDVDHLSIHDYLNLGGAGLKLRSLDRRDAYRFLRFSTMPVADVAAEWFENELLQATVAARGIFGSFAGPRSPGTTTGLLLQAALGGDALLMGNSIGSLAVDLAKAASSAGAEIRTKSEVSHIRVKDGEVASVVLNTGEEIAAKAVLSNTDPHHTFLGLVDAADLEPGFLAKVKAYRSVGAVAKVNLALSGLPAFSGIDNRGEDFAVRFHIGPDMDYLERAFDSAKYGDFSPSPYMDIHLPSIMDASLAPKGAHVMSIHVQYAPYRLKRGDWNARREELGDTVVKALASYAPKISEQILHRQIITPLDLEQTYGLSGGHIFHGEHALDQLFASRPILGWARYRTPIRGLYLCGSGTHPGGGITGAPGANAGREVLKDLKSRR